MQQFFTSILPMTLQAAGTSLISATGTRNQVYLPYSNTLKVFSSPFPESGTGSHGQNKLEFMAIISLIFFWKAYGHNKLDFFFCNSLNYMAIISLNFFCKVPLTNAGLLPFSCSLGSCLCPQNEMPMSPRHCLLLLC